MRTYNDKMFIETFEHEYTWLNGFMRNVARYGKRTALIDPLTERQWSYRELNAEVNRLAHALKADGVGKNDVVMSVLVNCPEFCFSYISPRKVGAIVNLANFKLSAGELSLLIDHNEPKVVIYAAEVRDMVAEAVQMAKHKPVSVVMADNLENDALPKVISPTTTMSAADRRANRRRISQRIYTMKLSGCVPAVRRRCRRAFLSTISTRCCRLTTLSCTIRSTATMSA